MHAPQSIILEAVDEVSILCSNAASPMGQFCVDVDTLA